MSTMKLQPNAHLLPHFFLNLPIWKLRENTFYVVGHLCLCVINVYLLVNSVDAAEQVLLRLCPQTLCHVHHYGFNSFHYSSHNVYTLSTLVNRWACSSTSSMAGCRPLCICSLTEVDAPKTCWRVLTIFQEEKTAKREFQKEIFCW